MGCGYSRLTPGGEMQKSKGVGILLGRHIVDIRKVRELGKIKGGDDALSKKELLKDGTDDDHEQRSSISSQEDSVQAALHPAELEAPKAQHIPQSILVQEPDEKTLVDGKKPEGIIDAITKEVGQETEGEDEEYGRLSNYDDEFPRSPSFRVYYIESMADKHDDIDDSMDNGMDDKSECIDYSQSEVIAKSCVTDEESTTDVKKRGTRVKRFRKAMHGGKSGSVKNLFTISCYSTSCTGHHHKCLVDGKAG